MLETEKSDDNNNVQYYKNALIERSHGINVREANMIDRKMNVPRMLSKYNMFQAVWDDREKLYDDFRFYKVFYYLADDLFEIICEGSNSQAIEAIEASKKQICS